MDGGVETVADAGERTASRRQARGVVAKSLALAAIATAIVYALP